MKTLQLFALCLAPLVACAPPAYAQEQDTGVAHYAAIWTGDFSDPDEVHLDHGESPSGTPRFALETSYGTFETAQPFIAPIPAEDWNLWGNTMYEPWTVFEVSSEEVLMGVGFTTYVVDDDSREVLTGSDADWTTLGVWIHAHSNESLQLGAIFSGSHYDETAFSAERISRGVTARYEGPVMGLHATDIDNVNIHAVQEFFGGINLDVTIHEVPQDDSIGTATGTIHSMRSGDVSLGDTVINLDTADITSTGTWEQEIGPGGEIRYGWRGSLSNHDLDDSIPYEAGGTFLSPLGNGLVVGTYSAADCARAECSAILLPR